MARGSSFLKTYWKN